MCVEAPAQQLDVTTFVVLGEGLAAGMADYALRDVYQEKSFPVLMATQMRTAFPQPLVQPPGIGSAVGFPALPVVVPGKLQTTVRRGFPPGLFIFNLSVPGMKVAEAISRRPVRPLVQKDDPQQTLINMTLGYPALLLGKEVPLWSQLEYAQQMRPTLVLVELGYADVLEAAVRGNPGLLPDVAAFRDNYSKILTSLKGTFADVVTTTIPDPMDTAYFTSLSGATRLIGAPAATLARLYNLQPDDLLTIPGLVAVGNQIIARSIRPLPAGSVVSRAVADQIRARVRALNTEINSAAQQNSFPVYDLSAFFARVRNQGVTVGTRTLTSDFGGGFYSLNGYHPGTTGHALICNEILALLNRTFGMSFQPVDAASFLGSDPAARSLIYRGREYTALELEGMVR